MSQHSIYTTWVKGGRHGFAVELASTDHREAAEARANLVLQTDQHAPATLEIVVTEIDTGDTRNIKINTRPAHGYKRTAHA